MTATTDVPDNGSAMIPPTAPDGLAGFVAAKVISADDVAAAVALVGIAARDQPEVVPDLRAWVAMCLALRASRDGHTCVVLDDIASLLEDGDEQPRRLLDGPADASVWTAALRSAGPLVGEPGDRAPFIIDGSRLYLARSLHEEQQIARRLLAADEKLEILLGGPGTGKTTQVAIRLVDLFRTTPEMRIALAAPTGKAAARMAEALQQRLHDPRAPAEVRDAPPQVRAALAAAHPTTIHALLGVRPRGTPRYKFHAANQLTYDLVVVDEASMLSSSLMHHLLEAVGPETRLLLVGDPDQLASVDAGSVLGDIAKAARTATSQLASRTTTLTVRHRFGPRIAGLADAILRGDEGLAQAFAILEGDWQCPPDPAHQAADDPASVRWVEPRSAAFAAVEEEVVAQARRLRQLALDGDAGAALLAQRDLQVLCAHRDGPQGVSGWNTLVEARLGLVGGSQWYAGRPVMVTANTPALALHNGDVGLVVPAAVERRMDVVFPVGKEARRLPVSRLEDVATVHALTIHKSQGSEYGHAIVVLPERPSRILTRELLYTGVTRATGRVTVVGSRAVIAAAIRQPIRRATGLAARLAGRG
jgi:exodeoxyribonuclease V alpha subunit